MENFPSILSVPEFAALIKVNSRWLYREVQSGHIPCIKIGRAVRIDRDLALASLSVPALDEGR